LLSSDREEKGVASQAPVDPNVTSAVVEARPVSGTKKRLNTPLDSEEEPTSRTDRTGNIETPDSIGDQYFPIGPWYRKKKSTKGLCSKNDIRPGLSRGDAVWYSQETRRVGTRLSVLIDSEREKKISRAALKELQEIKDSYTELMESMIMENAIIEGRLQEARVSEQSARIEQRVVLNKCFMEELRSEAGTPPNPKLRTMNNKRKEVPMTVYHGQTRQARLRRTQK